ncbi:endonuclease domain-containing protein [Nonomuraea rubra]|uniref:endonuclease domain-containing protein n=1 Tax=Nonomuraea rubra TaxID=46180 RepID=UPI0033E400C6
MPVRSWSELPVGRVVRLDADAEAVALSIDPLPPGAPAILTYLPGEPRSVAGLVASVLRELDEAAIALFPAWLPEAAGIEGPCGAHVPAVRSLALRRASASEHHGPFLAELAERALTGRASVLGPEVRVAGLARVLAESFGRTGLAVLVRVPDGLTPAGQEVLVAGCEWLAHRAAAGVWLTGAPLDAVDRVETVLPDLPGPRPAAPELGPGQEPPRMLYPAIAGRPHPGSAGEQALEAALAGCEWASGRAWNQTYQPHPLAAPIRVDLLWERERCVVEIDGADHRGAAKFAADRERDVRLQLDGYAVLRFLDVQVLTDMETVIRQIARFLRQRRRTEG